ncbi:unnamed protein product [Schistocephalus solidus]|uniref:Ovule protein n=1 Tax=Schistocephalus solidus TaxID=70667 RepID=A0A183S8A1_SCHSO|nr:unnamed protein product [Schistocephalus solidus]
MIEDQYKCLIFVCSLQSPRDAEIRTRLPSKIEQDPDSIPQILAAEYQRFNNLKHDSTIVEQPSSSLATTSVHAITHNKSVPLHKAQDSTVRQPLTALS